MNLGILKKKIDGYRSSNGCIRNVPADLLWELRQAWENFSGPMNQFRQELGIKVGTLRKLLADSKKLNHAMAAAGSVQEAISEGDPNSKASETAGNSVEFVYDHGNKTIRFPSVHTLVEFLRKAS